MDRKRKAVLLFESLMRSSKKRRLQEDEELENIFLEIENHDEVDGDEESEIGVMAAVSTAVSMGERKRGPCKPNIDRTHQKEFWTNGCRTWDNEQFKSRVRLTRESFEYIFTVIGPSIAKTPTNLVPNPIETHGQLGLTLYRLAHGSSYQVLEDVFGVSKALASETFNIVIRVLVAKLYDQLVVLPQTEDEWKQELKGFVENYAFPCVNYYN
jgi:hypothetical protein